MKSKLEIRLTRQLSAKGQANAAGLAHGLLVSRGHIKPDGGLTSEGKARQALGASGRAKDRAAQASGHAKSDYSYDAKTNQATLKK